MPEQDMTVQYATFIVKGRLRFGDPEHIAAVARLEKVVECVARLEACRHRFEETHRCGDCNGTGSNWDDDNDCPECNGEGETTGPCECITDFPQDVVRAAVMKSRLPNKDKQLVRRLIA